jgi:hypothetical protein
LSNAAGRDHTLGPPFSEPALIATRTALAFQHQTPVIPTDTVGTPVVETPLPGGVGAFVRTVLNAPSWLQITVIAAGTLLALGVVVFLWLRRGTIIAWLKSRSRRWKIALAGVAALALSGAATFSAASWNYTQHNNDFCIGCHVMGTAWNKFQRSEHKTLACHDCHQQSIFASMRQLYLWVAERPGDIPPHAKVPTAICQTCHNQSRPDSLWKHVINTAGHSVHLRSEDPKLKNVQCVTCHGAEVHHFVPIDKTCGQSGCHEATTIKLGKMAGQTSMHCTGCHNFTTEVAANISPDSAMKSLDPTGEKCFGCHQMKQRIGSALAELDPATEPHKAACGACHNPHKQSGTKQAFASCATAACHARADTLTPFHRGLPSTVLANCGTCHKAHVWKVQSTDCTACHRDLDNPRRGAGARKPSPHPVIKQMPTAEERPHGPFVADEIELPSQAVDTTTFSHAKHKAVECKSCHNSDRTHGEVTIKQPAGCLACHHGSTQKAACTTCHRSLTTRDREVSVTMSVWTTARSRVLRFAHDRHARVDCKTCHTTPTALAAEKSCASCHGEHHGVASSCASCHPAIPTTEQPHHPRIATHAGCGGGGCHTDAAVLSLPPTRNVCVACHREQVTHKSGGDCAACHLVSWPGGVR